MSLRLPILTLLAVLAFLPAAFANDEEEVTAGPKTPYFAAFNEAKVYLRFGPGKEYPVKWIYRKKDLPVEVTHTFEGWRKVKLPDGEFGWVNQGLLSLNRTVLVQGEGTEQMLYGSSRLENPVARVKPGTIMKLEECDRTACMIASGKMEGWIARTSLWGIYEGEQIP
jgi:SH3-like domain-containing protein